jgi:hypothetical protein
MMSFSFLRPHQLPIQVVDLPLDLFLFCLRPLFASQLGESLFEGVDLLTQAFTLP